jgi:hypothetical protein
MKWTVSLIFCWIYMSGSAQVSDHRTQYFKEEKQLKDRFEGAFYANSREIFSLAQAAFVEKIDSLKSPFDSLLNKYRKEFDPVFLDRRRSDYALSMDRWILFYPFFHYRFTKTTVQYTDRVKRRLDRDNRKLNNPAYLQLEGYNGYLESFLHDKTDSALKTGHFARSDNQKLDATWAILPYQ